MPEFRTQEELERAQWAEKFTSVAEGKLYTDDDDSPFPVHKYLRNKLLGKVQMLEVNAGAALVDQMVADTVTELNIQFGDEEKDGTENEIRDWLEEIEYMTLLEEAMRDWFATGYCVQQPIRIVEGKNASFTATNVDPSSWYPDIPAFTHQKITSGRIISVFDEGEDAEEWYAFVETHEIGTVRHQLIKLDQPHDLEGKEVALNTIDRFSDVKKEAKTDLDFLAIFQQNRRKGSRKFFGQSLLTPIWGLLQEVSEIQTQIRQERIKHLRAKMYGPRESFQKIVLDETDTALNSKLTRARDQINQAVYDLNQEIFTVPPGATVVPGYIQRDLQAIEKGSVEIDKLLSRIASIVGAPRSIFNLDERGALHVETEKKKDRRYVKHILQAQKKAVSLVTDVIETYWLWKHKNPIEGLSVELSDPFELTREEKVQLMKEMNPDVALVSQKQALKEVWPTMTPEERDTMLSEIEAENAQFRSGSQLSNPVPVDL